MQIIATTTAPQAIGPYSQAIIGGGLVWCSGQMGVDPASGKFVGDDVQSQTRQALANVRAVLIAAGSGLERVVKTTVFLADLDDFGVMNAIYAEAFAGHAPARSTVQVARLPRSARVEIEAVAEV